MSAYIDLDGMQSRFGKDEINQLLGAANGEISPEGQQKFSDAVNDASNFIDGFLGGRYTLPLSSVPDIVTGWAGDIARYKLWDDRATDEIRRRYDDCLINLKQLAQGLFVLPPGSNGQTSIRSNAGLIDGFSNPRIFTAERLRGY